MKLYFLPGCLGLLVSAGLFFSIWPQADIWVSQLFYAGDGKFPANQLFVVQAVYNGVPWIGRILFFISISFLLLAIFFPFQVSRRNWRRSSAFFCVVILGIGLIVHSVLKDGMGRPRPRDIAEFSGPTSYVPVFTTSHFCATNCSFVSGHAAVGFSLMSLGMLGVKRRRHFWFSVGLISGGLIGFVRIAQGGHFLSDIIFSFVAVWLTYLLIRGVWLRFRVWQLFKPRLAVPILKQNL